MKQDSIVRDSVSQKVGTMRQAYEFSLMMVLALAIPACSTGLNVGKALHRVGHDDVASAVDARSQGTANSPAHDAKAATSSSQGVEAAQSPSRSAQAVGNDRVPAVSTEHVPPRIVEFVEHRFRFSRANHEAQRRREDKRIMADRNRFYNALRQPAAEFDEAWQSFSRRQAEVEEVVRAAKELAAAGDVLAARKRLEGAITWIPDITFGVHKERGLLEPNDTEMSAILALRDLLLQQNDMYAVLTLAPQAIDRRPSIGSRDEEKEIWLTTMKADMFRLDNGSESGRDMFFRRQSAGARALDAYLAPVDMAFDVLERERDEMHLRDYKQGRWLLLQVSGYRARARKGRLSFTHVAVLEDEECRNTRKITGIRHSGNRSEIEYEEKCRARTSKTKVKIKARLRHELPSGIDKTFVLMGRVTKADKRQVELDDSRVLTLPASLGNSLLESVQETPGKKFEWENGSSTAALKRRILRRVEKAPYPRAK